MVTPLAQNGDDKLISEAVQAHLGITQSVIQRMASNSASCKAWCITLVSAILVIVADKGDPRFAMIAIIPTTLFLMLDAYYLALEKRFRASYNSFIEKLHKESLKASDLYGVSPTGDMTEFFLESLRSLAIWPFYLTLGVMIWITGAVVIRAS